MDGLERLFNDAKVIEREHNALNVKIQTLTKALDELKSKCTPECFPNVDANNNDLNVKYQELLRKYQEILRKEEKGADKRVNESSDTNEATPKKRMIKRGFDTKDFLDNLTAACLPVACPFNVISGCKKSYKSFNGIKSHLMSCHPVMRAQIVIDTPVKGGGPSKEVQSSSVGNNPAQQQSIAVARKYNPLDVIKKTLAKEAASLKDQNVVTSKIGSNGQSRTPLLDIVQGKKEEEVNEAEPKEPTPVRKQLQSAPGVVKRMVQMVTRNAAKRQSYQVTTVGDNVSSTTENKPPNNASHATPNVDGATVKPVWMSQSFFDSIIIKGEQVQSVPCLGCGKVLTQCPLTSRFRLEDYIHMIEDCQEYQRMGMVEECTKCRYKFILDNVYLIHDC